MLPVVQKISFNCKTTKLLPDILAFEKKQKKPYFYENTKDLCNPKEDNQH